MPTPLVWKNKFQINAGSAATGGQSEPRIIGLSGGRILVVWVEDAAGTVGGGAGKNIIGAILNQVTGEVSLGPTQLNTVSTIDDEEDFDIAATANGGFILVYIDDDISSPNLTSIVWERLDSSMVSVDDTVIATENVASDSLSNPQVAVNQDIDQSVVTFTRLTDLDADLRGVLVSASGVAGAEYDAAANSGDFAGTGEVAILANGNYVSVYRESDAGVTGAEARIMTNTGTLVANLTLSSVTVGMVRVATLANGNWVAAWSETGVGNGDIRYAIYGPTGGAPVLAAQNAASGTNIQATPDIVALRDGGFVIVWDNDSTATIEAQRFTAAGVADGGVFQIESGGGSAPAAALTADGRLLFTWVAPNGEISASIWDPRGTTMNLVDYANGARNFVDVSGYFMGGEGHDTINATGVTEVTDLYGLDGNDILIGGGGFREMDGGAGNDILIGGGGVQFMTGGLGDDTYYVDDVFDSVIGIFDGAGDHIYTSVSWFLQASVNTLSLGRLSAVDPNATTSINLGGNSQHNTITANNGDNELSGLDGNDVLIGNGGNDTLTGGEGDDVLNGGTGVDTMRGGNGSDTYFVDNAGDLVEDTFPTGFNIVAASVSYTLGVSDIIRLLTTGWVEGTAPINLTGNQFTTQIWGNNGANILTGIDNYNELFGFGGADDLRGGGGNDALFGGSGNDTMRGGLGNDTFFVEEAGDIIVEVAGEGSDVIAAGVDYAIGAGASVELMTTGWIGGTMAIALTGNELGNEIWGNDGVNFMHGGNGNVTDSLLGFGGNDRLDGGGGLDLLIGGTGQDSFAFTAALVGAAADIIADFSSADDTILLDDAVFTGLALGALNPAAFVIGAAALDANDRIIYDSTNGRLYFDADGSGAGAAVQFAVLSGNPVLSASDFTVI